MRITHKASSLLKPVAAALAIAGSIASSQAINVLVSGGTSAGDATANQPTLDFLTTHFQDVNITYGNYGDTTSPATLTALANADLFIVCRKLSSGDYTTADNSVFDALTIPMVSLTSFVTRSSRMGWEGGDVSYQSTTGDETTVTAAGAAVFGAAVAADWWSGSVSFGAAGTGAVGDGVILATLGGQNLVVGWNAGDANALGNTFAGERLLFNFPDTTVPSLLPDTAAGQQALIDALVAYTPLQVAAVPEPSTFALAGFGLAALLVLRRRM